MRGAHRAEKTRTRNYNNQRLCDHQPSDLRELRKWHSENRGRTHVASLPSFDDRGTVKTYHIRTGNKAAADHLLKLSERHGLRASEQIVEHAAFCVSGTIKQKSMVVPNFHYFECTDFVQRWEAVERGEPPVPSTVTTRLG